MYLQIGATRLAPQDIDVRQRMLVPLDQAAQTEAGHAGALSYFFTPVTHAWVFGSATAFYRAALALVALPAELRCPRFSGQGIQ